MNTLEDDLNIYGHLTVSSASVSQLTTTGTYSAQLSASHSVILGSHTFDANQLGQLLTYLISQHPELSV